MSDQPDLFSTAGDDDDFMPYNNTAGYVNQPASVERAATEATTGAATKRAQDILKLLSNHDEGLTYQQVCELMNLHHGQASGALSILHKSGLVFMLKEKRNKCHPYVHIKHQWIFNADERIDEPAQTSAGARREQLEQLLEAVLIGVANNLIHDAAVINIAKTLKQH
jgi:hypothetical protein